MKKLVSILFILFLAVGFIACSKEHNVNDEIPNDIPEWLKTEIATMHRESDKKPGGFVDEYRISGDTFFNISYLYLSCVYCYLRREDGTTPQTYPEGINTAVKVRTIWRDRKAFGE